MRILGFAQRIQRNVLLLGRGWRMLGRMHVNASMNFDRILT
jgi:hypothetical protein